MKNIYLMKDISKVSGQSIYTIKFYLKIGLLREIGRSPETNFRYFDDTTLERLQKIRQMRSQRKSLKDIKKELEN
jgi:MerR family transcriptional regulator, copper efflux regulator